MDSKFQNLEKEYKPSSEHSIFIDLKRYHDFYGQWSMSVLHFSTMGTNAIMNVDSYIYSSMQGTLESIEYVLKNGRIGDGYGLLRKYYDSVVTNIYINLYLKENVNLKNSIVKKIDDWLKGKEKIPKYDDMLKYILTSPQLTALNNLIIADERYKKIKDRCNDNLHYNFFENFLINDNQIYIKDRSIKLDGFVKDVREIFILHLSYIFFLNDHYMASSDYIDLLEVGVTPEEESQYWVAPFIQQAFDDFILKERPEIASLIKQSSSMHIC